RANPQGLTAARTPAATARSTGTSDPVHRTSSGGRELGDPLVELQVVQVTFGDDLAGTVDQHVQALLGYPEALPHHAGVVGQVGDAGDVHVRYEGVLFLLVAHARDAEEDDASLVLGRGIGHGGGLTRADGAPRRPEPQHHGMAGHAGAVERLAVQRGAGEPPALGYGHGFVGGGLSTRRRAASGY